MGAERGDAPLAFLAAELAPVIAQLPQPVALTGGTGFVGSHLLDVLVEAGASVRVLVRDPSRLNPCVRERVQMVVGGLDSSQALAKLVRGCGVVLHLAGVVRAGQERLFFAANGEGTRRLVEAAGEAGRPRVIYVSSLAAAGPAARPEGKGPEEPAQPISAYGRSKLAGEQAVRSYGGQWLILRPPAIYGPRDRDVFTFFRLASVGWLPYPAGERWLSVAFVGDVVRAVVHAATSPHTGQVLHLGEGRPYALVELLRLLAEAGEVRARLIPLPATVFRLAGWLGDLFHLLGMKNVAMTSDKARELLARHWVAQSQSSLGKLGLPEPVPFAQGARLTWAWYRKAGWLPRGSM